jgi:ferredoxin
LGYSPDLADRCVSVFERPGGGGVGLVFSMPDSGIKALADSVSRELEEKAAKQAGKAPAILTVDVPHERHTLTIECYEGDTIMEVAESEEGAELAGYLELACGGNMACSTCHVIVNDPVAFARLPAPEDAELDMLDLAYGVCETSRLGCQLRLPPPDDNGNEPAKLSVTVPEQAYNHFN